MLCQCPSLGIAMSHATTPLLRCYPAGQPVKQSTERRGEDDLDGQHTSVEIY